MYTFFTQFFAMEGQKLRDSIALFYKLNLEKGKMFLKPHLKKPVSDGECCFELWPLDSIDHCTASVKAPGEVTTTA